MQLGRKKVRKKKKREWDETSTHGRELKVRRGSCTQNSPFTEGKAAGAERDFWGIAGKGSRQSVEGRTKQELHSWSPCQCFCPVHASPGLCLLVQSGARCSKVGLGEWTQEGTAVGFEKIA